MDKKRWNIWFVINSVCKRWKINSIMYKKKLDEFNFVLLNTNIRPTAKKKLDASADQCSLQFLT